MSVISISEVKCKDCYKCVRACPMKAIKIESGHAHIIEERCISDGHCLNVCPQGAKRVASDLDRVKEWLRSGLAVGASIAPSFPAFFGIDSATYLVRALKAKGFKLVQETSVGAEFVAREHRRLISIAPYSADGRRLPLLSSSCPAVINLIEKHYPEVISQVAPVVSPMVAHGKYLKSIAGRPDKVVFIGPCVAKRDELGRECNTIGKEAAVDAVLSFPEVEKWLGMDLCGSQEQGGDTAISSKEQCGDTAITDAAITEEGTIAKRLSGGPVSGGPLIGGPDELKNVKKIGCFDGPLPCWAKTFPVTGGLLKTAALDTDMTSEDVLTVCGVTECKELLEEIRSKDGFARYLNKTKLIELMACPGGCISGPHMRGGVSAVLRRALVLGYAVPGSSEEFWDREYEERGLDLSMAFSNRCVSYPDPPDEAIREILAQTGKTHREDELNCGACGYNSCREKAKAVYYGFAELEMCIPYMRAKAESLSDAVINSSPDGVVVVDNSLRVLSVNPAFERMFLCKQANIKMKKLDYLFDTRYIKEAMRTKTLVIKDVTYPSYNLITRQFIFPIEKNGVVVGILRDLTLEQKSKRELEVLRQETLERARAVIEKQMRVAQEIAGLLGETTAETKVLLTRLMEIVSSGEGRKQDASLRGSGDIPAS